MKANAPKKLYLRDTGILGDGISIGRFRDTDIEYTRTDAFIEKATFWLLINASDYCILHNSYDTKELIEDFITAMKRE